MTVIGLEALAPGQRREPACTAMSRAGCGPTSGRGASRKKFRSATSPTACTSRAGSPGRCCSFTIATSRPTGSSGWASPKSGRAFTRSIRANCGKRTTRSKNLLLAFVRRRVSRQCRRRGESDEAVEAARNVLDPNMLTIGFARRFATYKRADLILSDLDRLTALVNDQERPVQIVFAGKAHPTDEPGKQLIKTDRQPAARSAVRQPDRVRRGLRHQRLPAPDPRRRRVAEQSAASAGSLGHERPEGRAQRRAEPVDSRRLVGRSLRRRERLRDRPRHEPRVGRDHRQARRRVALRGAREAGDSDCTTIATWTVCRASGSR